MYSIVSCFSSGLLGRIFDANLGDGDKSSVFWMMSLIKESLVGTHTSMGQSLPDNSRDSRICSKSNSDELLSLFTGSARLPMA